MTEKQLLAVGKSEIVLIFGASESALPGDTKKLHRVVVEEVIVLCISIHFKNVEYA